MKDDYIPEFHGDRPDCNAMSATTLAFVGDAVQTLFVRTRLSLTHGEKSGYLHRLAAAEVSATAQAAAFRRIEPILTEAEEAVFRRCRNAKTNTVAKHASIGDYRIATGFEGLIGWLYLQDGHARLNELLACAYPSEQDPETRKRGAE